MPRGALLLWLLPAAVPAATPAPPAHPLIGTWQLALPGEACAETYEYRADGTGHTVSAGEETELEYAVEAEAGENGAWRLTETIVHSNGQPDCSGHVTPLGRPTTLYVAPLRGGLLLCFDQALRACLGPMTRIGAPGRGAR